MTIARLNVVAALLLTTLLAAQDPHARQSASRNAPVPFGLGERMTYKVTMRMFGTVGKGFVEVQDLDTINGFPTYQLRMNLAGGIKFARVDDTYESWLDTEKLISRRFRSDVHEVRYQQERVFEMLPAERRWRRLDKDESATMATSEPLDDLSFLFFARTLPLKVGETYTLNRYFKDDGNPVTLRVLRRETINTAVGTMATVVVRPIIKTKGLFGDDGKAEIFFTDDDRRIPVQINISVPVIGSLKMHLQSYTPGTRVAPAYTAPK